MKLLIVIVIIFAAVIFGLAYLPPETTASVGKESAGVAIRGCKGAKRFITAFRSNWEKDKPKVEEVLSPDTAPATPE